MSTSIGRWGRLVGRTRRLGLLGAWRYTAARSRSRSAGGRLRLSSKRLRHSAWARTGSSDLDVFEQIFLHTESEWAEGLKPPDVVFDLGANAGYFSALMLSMYSGCRIVAVEPDAENAAFCSENLAAYGRRAEVVNAAAWSHAGEVFLAPDTLGLGGEWSRRVDARSIAAAHAAVSLPTLPPIRAVTLDELFAEHAADGQIWVKIDIEGAEVEVFGSSLIDGSIANWVRRSQVIVAELHDRMTSGAASRAFFSGIGSQFSISRSGELTVAIRRPLP